jgi:hypothetical protein
MDAGGAMDKTADDGQSEERTHHKPRGRFAVYEYREFKGKYAISMRLLEQKWLKKRMDIA